MLKEFIDRENEIFNILNSLRNHKLDFILIGGYAVSAFQHRFSVDADIIIQEENLNETIEILQKNNFEIYKSTNLKDTYKGKFKAFIKKTPLPITVDLLINSVTSRQTDATWGYELFKNNSIEKEIKGIEKSIVSLIPVKELLIATKLHPCRLTDIRDIVAICNNTDINKILNFVLRGNLDSFSESLLRFKNTIKSKNFADAFKGAFSLERLPSDNIKFSEKIVQRIEKAIAGKPT